jgi:hypothetical protein
MYKYIAILYNNSDIGDKSVFSFYRRESGEDRCHCLDHPREGLDKSGKSIDVPNPKIPCLLLHLTFPPTTPFRMYSYSSYCPLTLS